MLPIETFAHVVSFMGYYDLGGLKLANRMLSAVASQCSDAIRVFDFADFAFLIDDTIDVYRLSSHGCLGPWVCRLELTSEKNLAVFVSEAFRNCIVGVFLLWRHRERVLNATNDVAKTIAVAATLSLLPTKRKASRRQILENFHRSLLGRFLQAFPFPFRERRDGP